MAPKRELPSLHIKIVADPSSALKGIESIIEAAVKGSKKISKAVKEQVDNAEKEFLREFHNYRLLQKSKEIQHKEAQRRMKKIDDAARKEREDADKASAERRKQIEKDTVDFFKKQSKRQSAFDNADGNKNYGQLTGFGKSVRSAAGRDKPVKSTALDDLVKNAETNAKKTVKAAAVQKSAMASANAKLAQQVKAGARIQRAQSDEAHREQRQASRRMWSAKKAVIVQRRKDIATEAAIMAKAASERTKQIEQSRNAVKKQTEQMTKEEKRATSRMWARKRDFIIQARKDANAKAKGIAGANAKLAAAVKAGAKAQRIQANADHRQSRRESRRMWAAKKAVIIQARKDAAAATAAQQAAIAANLKQQQQQQKTLQNIQKAFAKIRQQQADEDARVLRRQRIRTRDRLRQQRADAEEQARDEARQLRRQRQRRVRQLQHRRDNGLQNLAGRAMEGLRSGNMMGARADVYMHRQSLDTIGRGVADFMRPYAEVENATVAMKVFTGSVETAKATVAELHQYSIESPYSLSGVLQASQLLMKYGASAKQAVEYTKMLGDVAGGDSDKLKLLGLALGQMKGIGTVQGQEVRQMVNAGFNPLQVAAKEMAGGDGASEEAIATQMQVLLDAMRHRQLDWKLVVAALKVATSKGGDFAGMAEEQSKTVMGLTNQIMETIGLLQKEIAETFAEDLRKLLREVLKYATALVDWVKKNKDLVKSYVDAAIEVGKFIIGLHAFGFALAWTRWMIGTVVSVLGLYTTAVEWATAATTALTLSTNANAAGWGRWMQRVGQLLTWLRRIVSVVLLVGFVIDGLTSKDGFSGATVRWTAALVNFLGFMWNFGHNVTQIFTYIGKNWGLLIVDMLSWVMSPIELLINSVAKVMSFFSTTMSDYLYSIMPGIRDHAIRILDLNKEYDNSMFKFGMGDSVLDSIKKTLDPHVKKDTPYVIPEKPEVDFNSFLKGGKNSDIPKEMAPEHAVSGSADHAVRMYKYGLAAQAEAAGGGPESHEDKMEDLLGKIERNTRTAPNPNALVETADLG